MIGLLLFLVLGAILFVLWLILAILGCSRCNPTLLGVVVSLFLGVLPIYLILCFFGLMGDEKR